MTYTIAITGKGGVGKTTVAAIIVSRLIARGCKPVLAVDADPNTCLDAALGVAVTQTIGWVREQAKEIAGKGMSTGVPKQQMLEMKIAESLVEADNFDLIAMGRSEGPGCYCFANNVLKQAIQTLATNYAYIVIDNEAGLEHLSRRVVPKVDLMVIVADPSKRGMQTLERLHQLTGEMGIQYGKLVMVINRLRRGELPEGAEDLKHRIKADFLIGLPDDLELSGRDEDGESLRELPLNNEVVRRIDALLEEAGVTKKVPVSVA